MKLLVDGVFFQLVRTGIARVWSSILPRFASCPDLEIVLLDRGGCPSIDGIERVEFPSYTSTNTAHDSFLIDRFCRDREADVFMSTYYTTPVTIPSVLIVHDMIPEVLGFNLDTQPWKEKQIAISFASYYACVSENTRSDLKRFYPSITDDRSIVTHNGVARDVFQPRDRAQVEDFKRRFGIWKSYYVLVGSREQTFGYKNAALLFGAVRQIRDSEIEIVCIGGEPDIRQDCLDGLPSGISFRRVNLTDNELSCAYSGADALIYPSLYEGFGMPVVEAMACGCPVITTRLGALGEISGDAAIFISGRDQDELRHAMALVREPNHRERLITSGLQRAALYSWDVMARELHDLLKKAQKERENPATKRFHMDWKSLRAIQAEVDIGL